MAAVGGPILILTINGRPFPVAADAESNRKLGGFENEVEANGDGSARIIKTREPLMLEAVPVEIDDNRADHEYLQDQANGLNFIPIAITYASGITWQASAQLTGPLDASSKNATMPVTLKGPGLLTRQN